MLEKFDILSVNQKAAQIKITEAWKASRDEDYPVKLRKERQHHDEDARSLRPGMSREMVEGGITYYHYKSVVSIKFSPLSTVDDH